MFICVATKDLLQYKVSGVVCVFAFFIVDYELIKDLYADNDLTLAANSKNVTVTVRKKRKSDSSDSDRMQ